MRSDGHWSFRRDVARRTATVIGIARDTDVSVVLGESRPFVYLPLAQHYEPFLVIVARCGGGAALAVRALRDAVRRADPDLAIDVIGTGSHGAGGPFVFLRGVGFTTLALGALTLAAGDGRSLRHPVAHRRRTARARSACACRSAPAARKYSGWC